MLFSLVKISFICMALQYELYISTASTPADQPCDHEMLRQSKGSCNYCETIGYMCYNFVNRSTDV